MRLSPFHKQIAKLMAQGLPNREIKKQVKICDSRLSVLRSNKLMQREIEHYRALEESKYAGAIEVFKQGAEKVAEKLVNMVVNDPNTKDVLRLKTAESILDRLAAAEGMDAGNNGQQKGSEQEVVFEQLLRVSQRASSTEDAQESAFLELEEDSAQDSEPDGSI